MLGCCPVVGRRRVLTLAFAGRSCRPRGMRMMPTRHTLIGSDVTHFLKRPGSRFLTLDFGGSIRVCFNISRARGRNR